MGLEILLSPAIGTTKDAIAVLWRRFKKPDRIQLIERRQTLKTEVETHLRWIYNSARYGEFIIRDVKRADQYPNVDEKARRVSAWYKAELLGTYHRGLQLGLDICSLKRCPDEASWYLTWDYTGRDVKAILVGRIPYDRIVVINWKGDEYYGSPHIYCRFSG